VSKAFLNIVTSFSPVKKFYAEILITLCERERSEQKSSFEARTPVSLRPLPKKVFKAFYLPEEESQCADVSRKCESAAIKTANQEKVNREARPRAF
jgi:hypothetical protein